MEGLRRRPWQKRYCGNPISVTVHFPCLAVDRYNAVFNEILAEPNVKSLLDKQGLIAQGGPPQRLADLIAKDRPRWAKVVKDAQITAE